MGPTKRDRSKTHHGTPSDNGEGVQERCLPHRESGGPRSPLRRRCGDRLGAREGGVGSIPTGGQAQAKVRAGRTAGDR